MFFYKNLILLIVFMACSQGTWAADECPQFAGDWEGSCVYDDGKVFLDQLRISRSDCQGVIVSLDYGSDSYGNGGGFSKKNNFAGLRRWDETVTSGWVEGNTKFWIDRMKISRASTGSLYSGTRERTVSTMGFDKTPRTLKIETALNGESEGPNPKKWQRKKTCTYRSMSPN